MKTRSCASAHFARRDFLRQLSAAATAAALGDDVDFNRWLQPVPAGAVFEHPDWCIWCGSAVRGDDGKYHLFYQSFEPQICADSRQRRLRTDACSA